MPIYEFECRSHGVFELERPLSQAKGGATCPACGAASARILSVPRIPALAKNTRVALDHNLRSQHEPKVVSREAMNDGVSGPPHRHPHAHRQASGAVAGRARAYTGARPWVIEHG